ncbi:MAG: hypothetical protein K9N34_05365 [Candidatus Marinimicrobia bacterium]|nr:hypothetical protein [Candidatus Neomarinimicrobiota bacterium]MCF7840334.1 hypothetical protein [Candidatus Neomarinimicrobiota bacterium]
MKWMRRIFIVIGVLTLIHQYIWYQRTPNVPSKLIAPEEMTVWANNGGMYLTDTTTLVSIGILKEAYGARHIHLKVSYEQGGWYADPARETTLEEVIDTFPFLNYWLSLTGDDTTGVGALVHLIQSRELGLQVVISSHSEATSQELRTWLPRIPQIMPPTELQRFMTYRKILLLPFFHTGYDVAVIPLDTTRENALFKPKFIRALGHLGIPVWVDGVENLSQVLWLAERKVKSVRMDRVDLALLPRATLQSSLE